MQNSPTLRQRNLPKHLLELQTQPLRKIIQLGHFHATTVVLPLALLLLLQELLEGVVERPVVPVSRGSPFIGCRRRRRSWNTHHGKLLDKIPERAFRQRTLYIFQCFRIPIDVGLLHQLFESLGHRFRALQVNLVAEPFGKGDELAQLLVCIDYNVMRQQVKTVESLHDTVQVGGLQTQDVAKFLELG